MISWTNGIWNSSQLQRRWQKTFAAGIAIAIKIPQSSCAFPSLCLCNLVICWLKNFRIYRPRKRWRTGNKKTQFFATNFKTSGLMGCGINENNPKSKLTEVGEGGRKREQESKGRGKEGNGKERMGKKKRRGEERREGERNSSSSFFLGNKRRRQQSERWIKKVDEKERKVGKEEGENN